MPVRRSCCDKVAYNLLRTTEVNLKNTIMKAEKLDKKYKGYFPNDEVAEKADTARLMDEKGALDGTKKANEDYRRDENGLEEMERPDKTGAVKIPHHKAHK